jgi:A/G-specific adenine glycosylase
MKKFFTRNIIDWHLKENKRIMPWKGEKDAYKIWISEIILQQTRVSQGLAYYNNFIKEFPTIKSLAAAADEAVFKVWEGLGYYSRCKNLLSTARFVDKELQGKFPETYENILKLKGIGPYTAAAISSFAYGLPHAVVDGNVFRVLARFFGEATPVDSPAGKQLFSGLANQLLHAEHSAIYNQAIMDFGATVCKPKLPACEQCKLQSKCVAYNNASVSKLPVKEKQLFRKKRFFTYFLFLVDDIVLVKKREEKDIWQNLYEFYLFESDKLLDWNRAEVEQWLEDQFGLKQFSIVGKSALYKQQLTHQNLEGKFIRLRLVHTPHSLKHMVHLKSADLTTIAFPRFINQYLQDYPVFTDKAEINLM